LVADIHDMVQRTARGAVLSASVGSVPKRALHHFQDGQRWAREGLVDVVMLMNYTDSPETFEKRLEPWLADEPETPIVPGLWFGRTKEFTSEEERCTSVARQIEIAQARAGHFCVFTYSSLFDSRDDQLTDQDEKRRLIRAERRDRLLPLLQSMAETRE
jgi:uncharacterized lipoprotein YddW (UPF0748 family)